YGVHRLGQGLAHDARDELGARGVSLGRRTGKHPGDSARAALGVAREGHVQHEVVAGHARDFEQLAVQRIIFERAFHRAWIAHEARAVQRLDRLGGGEARRDKLAPAGKARHQMRLDKSHGDVQVRGDESPVEIDARAGGGGAQVLVSGKIGAIVVRDGVIFGDVAAANFLDFGGGGGAMRAGGDEDKDIRASDPGAFEPPQHGRQNFPVGHGARDIADGDGRGFFAARKLRQGRPGERGVEAALDGRGGTGERRGRARLQKAIAEAFRQLQRYRRFSEGKFNLHGFGAESVYRITFKRCAGKREAMRDARSVQGTIQPRKWAWSSARTPTSAAKRALCQKVSRSTWPSWPARPTVVTPTAIFWGEIILPATAPDELVAASRMGLTPT